MAFWIDPPLLVATGIVIAWISKNAFEGSDMAVYASEILAMIGTYAIAIGLFLNLDLLRPVWELLGAETGTAFMINGWILGLVDPATTWTDLGAGSMGLAIVLFALYPVWLRLGVISGRVLVGRNPSQGGLIGLIQPE